MVSPPSPQDESPSALAWEISPQLCSFPSSPHAQLWSFKALTSFLVKESWGFRLVLVT